MQAASRRKLTPTILSARLSFTSRRCTSASTNILHNKTDPDVTSMKLSIPKPTSEMLPAIAPATTATKPSKAFHAMVKYSSLRPWRTTAARSKTAISAMSRVYNAFSRVRLNPCLPREALGLRSRERRLPYVIRHVRRPTQEHGEFAPVRFSLELFLRNGGMPPRPIRRRELRKPFPEPLVDLVPCRLERLSRHRKFDGSIRFRNEHFVEFRVKPFANA